MRKGHCEGWKRRPFVFFLFFFLRGVVRVLECNDQARNSGILLPIESSGFYDRFTVLFVLLFKLSRQEVLLVMTSLPDCLSVCIFVSSLFRFL